MTSKECLSDLYFLAIGDENHTKKCKEIIEKDLEVLDCFKKIDKQELKDFIEYQIRYTLNENTWLTACNCDLEKEESTKHLIKIKEWLDNDK